MKNVYIFSSAFYFASFFNAVYYIRYIKWQRSNFIDFKNNAKSRTNPARALMLHFDNLTDFAKKKNLRPVHLCYIYTLMLHFFSKSLCNISAYLL